MKIKDNKLKNNFILATYVFLLVLTLMYFPKILAFAGTIISTIKPFIIGLGIAFVLNILVKIFELKIIPKIDKKNRFLKYKRAISIILATATMFLSFWALVVFVLPQLIESCKILFESIPEYMKHFETWIMPYLNSVELINSIWESVIGAWKEILQVTTQVLGQSVNTVVNTTFSITSGVVQIILGFVISIYMIASKEELILHIKKVLYAIFEKKTVKNIIRIGRITNDTFSKFIAGQCMEALIIGCLCFVGMIMFKMPYPLLISVIIGCTNMIPIFGPIIGTIPGAFILLMINPTKALWFIVFIVVLQQIESNLIYPKVVGNSIGLSAIWVLFAITLGGGMFGLLGMLLGVPTVAVVYSLVRDSINSKLTEKKIVIKK